MSEGKKKGGGCGCTSLVIVGAIFFILSAMLVP